MNIAVAYRSIPSAPGWSTGECVCHELVELGHTVVPLTTTYGGTEPTPDAPEGCDLLIYLEMNDGDSQFAHLRHLQCPKVYWTFDDETYPERAVAFAQYMRFDHVCYASANSPFAGRPNTTWLPYGISHHAAPYRNRRPEQRYRCALVGSAFPARVAFVQELRYRGLYVELLSGLHQRDYLDALASTAVVLDYHRSGGAGLLVQRVWDTLAVGSCLLTEAHPSFDALELTGHVVQYSGIEECAKQLYWLLVDGRTHAERTAVSGHEAGWARHTLRHRVQRLLEVVA